MKTELHWLFPMLLFPLIAHGGGRELELRLTSPKIVAITPGKIVTASFLVSNNTVREEEVVEELELPPAWHKISPIDGPFVGKEQTTQVRLLAISVPATASSGQFKIAYRVRSRRDYALADSAVFTVQVLAVGKLELVVQDQPQPVIAGEQYDVKLRVINRGNSRTRLSLLIKGSPNFPVSLDPSVLSLEAGSSQDLRLTVKTDESLRAKVMHILTVKAVAEAGSEATNVEASVSTAAEIIPKVTGQLDPYHRLPTRLRATGAKDRGEAAGLQVEFSGAGSLDESGRRKIDFLFRGPDLQEQSMYGTRDEYRISYCDKFFNLHLGDRNYVLSPLTERYGYGRGAEMNIHPGPFGAGVFYMQSRWRKENFDQIGAYVQKDLTPVFSLRGNFLSKNGSSAFLTNAVPARIYSIQPHLNFGKPLQLNFEYGWSQASELARASDNAWRIEAKGELFRRLTYSVEKVRAGPEFYGYYNDSDATFGALTLPIYGKLRANASFSQYANNLELNATKGQVANRETIYRPGLFYTFPFRTDTSIEYQSIRRTDRLLPAAYDFQEKSVRFGAGHSFGKVSLQTFIEKGEVDNFVSGKRNASLDRYSFYVFYRPTPRQSYSVYARLGDSSFTAAQEKSQTFGGSANWNLADNLSFAVQYARNSYNNTLNTVEDVAHSTISYTFPNQHNIGLSGRWTRNSVSKSTESSIFLTYTIPLSLPVGRKKSIGVLKGQVLDAENGRTPMAKVVLTANEATAVTDRNGEFVFPSLEPGTYVLRVQQKSIGVERLTTMPLPFMVEVQKATVTRVQVDVVTSSSFSARLVIVAGAAKSAGPNQNHAFAITSDIDKPKEFHEVAGLEGGLVEISNETEMFRQLTDRKGAVSFERLRPGKWTFKVYENNLPAHHHLESAETQIELKPGEKREASIRILPRHRRIQFIDQGTIK